MKNVDYLKEIDIFVKRYPDRDYIVIDDLEDIVYDHTNFKDKIKLLVIYPENKESLICITIGLSSYIMQNKRRCELMFELPFDAIKHLKIQEEYNECIKALLNIMYNQRFDGDILRTGYILSDGVLLYALRKEFEVDENFDIFRILQLRNKNISVESFKKIIHGGEYLYSLPSEPLEGIEQQMSDYRLPRLSENENQKLINTFSKYYPNREVLKIGNLQDIVDGLPLFHINFVVNHILYIPNNNIDTIVGFTLGLSCDPMKNGKRCELMFELPNDAITKDREFNHKYDDILNVVIDFEHLKDKNGEDEIFVDNYTDRRICNTESPKHILKEVYPNIFKIEKI